jgi:hypothetical protein
MKCSGDRQGCLACVSSKSRCTYATTTTQAPAQRAKNKRHARRASGKSPVSCFCTEPNREAAALQNGPTDLDAVRQRRQQSNANSASASASSSASATPAEGALGDPANPTSPNTYLAAYEQSSAVEWLRNPLQQTSDVSVFDHASAAPLDDFAWCSQSLHQNELTGSLGTQYQGFPFLTSPVDDDGLSLDIAALADTTPSPTTQASIVAPTLENTSVPAGLLEHPSLPSRVQHPPQQQPMTHLTDTDGNSACACLMKVLGAFETLEVAAIQGHQESMSAIDNILSVNKSAMIKCNTMLDCPSCQSLSSAAMLLIVVARNIVIRYGSSATRLRSTDSDDSRLLSDTCPPGQDAHLGTYSVDTSEEWKGMLAALAIIQGKSLGLFLKRIRAFVSSKNWDVHQTLLQTIDSQYQAIMESLNHQESLL